MTTGHAVRFAQSPIFQIAIIALIWEFISRTLLAPWHVLPPPSTILATLWETRASLYPHLRVTGEEALYGYLWGNATAITLAVIAFLLPSIEPMVGRAALAVHCMPLLVLAPILQILFSNMMPVIILSGIFVLFTTFIAALVGLRQVDHQSVMLVRACGGSRKDELLHVRFIAWLPSLLGGLSQAAPAAVVGAMVGEYMGSTTGLGVAMVYAQSAFQVERTWAICALATALALIAFATIQGLGRVIAPWARDHQTISASSVADVPRHGSKWKQRARLAGTYAVFIAVLVGLWYGGIWILFLDPYFAKTPWDLWIYLTTDPQAASHRGQFVLPTITTLLHAGGGLALGFCLALSAAILVRFWKPIEGALTPYLLLISSIPIAAMIPIISLCCGRSWWAVIVAVALMIFLPSFITILVGFRSAPEQATHLVRVSGGSLGRAIWTVQLPFAVPWLIASFKTAGPIAMGGSLLGEWLITGDGLAMVMQQGSSAGDYTAIWTAGIWIVLLSCGFYTLVAMAERPLLARLQAQAS